MSCYSVRYRTSSRGDLFEIETTEIWEVVDAEGRIVRTYTSESSGTMGTGAWNMEPTSGISWVELTEDGRGVRVTRNGVAQIEPLP